MTKTERTKEIEKFIEKLEEFWKKHPEERFGQLLFNHTEFGTRVGLGKVVDPFHFQDKDILENLKEGLRNYID